MALKKYNIAEAKSLTLDSFPLVVSENATTKAARSEQILFWIFLFYGTGVNSYNVTDLSLVVMTFVGFSYLLFVRKGTIDRIFWYVLLYWCVVNFFAWAYLGEYEFKISTFIGSILKLAIGYSFIKIFEERFILWFEKAVYILAWISIPFFIVQLINPSLFLNIPFNFAAPERMEIGDWNGIIFNCPQVHLRQNSGFAGEPGTFGYYIGFAAIFNLILNNGKITRRFVILLALGLTTVSTNYYLSVLFFGAYYLYSSKGLLKYAALILCIPAVYIVFQLPFLGNKIDVMLGDANRFAEGGIMKWTRVNRFAYFISQVGAIGKFPLGYGISENAMLVKNLFNQVLDGTNGVTRMGVRFGVFGMIYFFVIVFKFFNRIFSNFLGAFILFVIVMMYLGANPMERDYFLTALFWMYFFVPKATLTSLQQRYVLQKRPFPQTVPNLS